MKTIIGAIFLALLCAALPCRAQLLAGITIAITTEDESSDISDNERVAALAKFKSFQKDFAKVLVFAFNGATADGPREVTVTLLARKKRGDVQYVALYVRGRGEKEEVHRFPLEPKTDLLVFVNKKSAPSTDG